MTDTYDRDSSTCCGKPLRFDPEFRGETCGGLALIGWMVCDVCGGVYLAPKTMCRVDDGAGAPWRLAKGGRSVECGAIKLRAEGKTKGPEVEALMLRIVKLPELEAEVVRLRAALGEVAE